MIERGALAHERHAAGRKHILVVDMYDAFTANPDYQTAWMFDGLHPNDTGYARMAKVWYTTLGPLLH